MMNILVNLPEGFFRAPEIEPVFERLSRFGEVRRTSHNTSEEIRPDLAWAEAVLMWSWPVLSDTLLDEAPGLKYCGHLDISQAGARVALTRGQPASVSRGGWSPAVSEMALALILSLLRKTPDYHAQMRQGTEHWVSRLPADVDPRERELTGRPLGLVGFGQVGRRLAELLAPFRCPLWVVDPFASDAHLQAHQARRVGMDEMLTEADIVVLCAAANAGTHHLLGKPEIEKLRPNAILINVARAALVDTDALTERLRRGDLSAAVDVFDKEPLEHESVLRTLPNLYLTPHRAGGTMASVLRTLHWLIDDLESLLAGEDRRYALTEAMIPSLDA